MRWIAFILSALLLPLELHAQEVAILSGEHNGFSRLVLRVGDTANWELGRVEGGYEFRSASSDLQYDTSKVFQFIPRDRVADVEDRGDGRLFISSTCNCHIFAFEAGPRFVALDIRDGPATQDALAFNTNLDSRRPPNNEASTSSLIAPLPNAPGNTTTQADDGEASRETIALPLTPSEGPRKLSLPLIFDGAGTFETEELVEEATQNNQDEKKEQRVQETEQALLEKISRAATQGLLDADIPEPRSAQDYAEPATTAPENMLQPPERPITDDSHVSITTSVDRASNSGQKNQTDRGQSCLPDRLFDINNWGDPVETGSEIGTYRSQIIGEFDEADGEGVTALVRHYIYITFGAEAIAVMERFPNEIERPDLLFMMAEIMDHGHATDAASIADQMACSGPVALWAAAAQPELYKYQQIDSAAVRLTFSMLPPHLRTYIGPILATKFLAIDDKVTADALRTSTSRLLETPTPSLELLDARSELAENNTQEATEILDRVTPKTDDLLPDALIERVEASLAEGESVPNDVIELVESVGFEHRGTETGALLARTEIRALASAGRFKEAFLRLDGARRDGTAAGDTATNLNHEIFSLLVRNASDSIFITRAVNRIPDAVKLDREERFKISKRLLNLGFPDQARVVLNGEGDLPQVDDRLLYAEIALAQEKPQIAVGYLAGLKSEEALQLLARAMSTAQDHDGSFATYAELGAVDQQMQQAWLGGMWDEVSRLDDGTLGEASSLMLNEPSPSTSTPVGQLAQDQQLIEKSKSTRTTIGALLTRLDEPITNAAAETE